MFQNNKRRQRSQGFTLIELMLSVGFIGSLLVLIALIIIQVMGLYNKGLTLKEVNEVSRTMVRDMQQSISSADKFEITYKNSDGKQAYATTIKEASDHSVDAYSNDAGGRFCTGVYSYVWNTAGALGAWRDGGSTAKYTSSAAPADNPNRWHTAEVPASSVPAGGYPVQLLPHASGDAAVPVRFVKKLDPGKALCRVTAAEATSGATLGKDLPGDAGEYSTVFGSGDNHLVLYSMNIETPSVNASAANDAEQLTAVSTYYYLSLTLGTQNGEEADNGNGLISGDVSCKPPVTYNPDGSIKETTENNAEYCAVNKIDFVARTGRIGR